MKSSDKRESKSSNAPKTNISSTQKNSVNFSIGGHPQQGEYNLEDFMIDSKFDEGNIMNPSKVEPFHYQIYVAPDCCGTIRETKNRTWFYFRISNIKTSGIYTFTIKDMNNQSKLISEGLVPVYRTIPSLPKWRKIPPQTPKTLVNENGMDLSFKMNIDKDEEQIYIAYTWPWSYEEDQKQLDEYEEKYKDDDEIYFNRELVINSKENRRIDLITITSRYNMMNIREKVLPNLFPGAAPEKRPFIFDKKKYVFISSRVHPGENSAAYVFNGLLSFLVNKTDPRAKAARHNFVFVMIPCLNPDGVYRGHYRVDPLGQNLNRFYTNPSFQDQPSIYAAKNIVLDLSQTNRLFLYVDLHSHATKRGTFVYGNSLPYREQVEYRLFPKLLSLNSRYFDYDACNFSEKNLIAGKKDGSNKEGAGRVALWKATGLIQCYTLECNFANGPLYNVLREPKPLGDLTNEQDNQDIKDTQWDAINNEFEVPKDIYNPEGFEEIGHGIAISCLDLCDINPLSRVRASTYKNLRNIKLHIALGLLKQSPFRFDTYLRKLNKNIEKNIDNLLLYIDKNIKKEIKDDGTSYIIDKDKDTRQNIRELSKKDSSTLKSNSTQKEVKIVSMEIKFPTNQTGKSPEAEPNKAMLRPKVNVIIRSQQKSRPKAKILAY